jgi:hypothetical protein
MASQQVSEICVFRENNRIGFTSLEENVGVRSFTKA